MKTYNGEQVDIASYKLDGHSLLISKSSYGQLTAYTPHPHDITHEVKDAIFTVGMLTLMPEDTIIRGELWYPGKPASYLSTARAKRDKNLCFSCFSVDGYTFLESSDLCCAWGIPFVPYVSMSNEFKCEPLPDYGGAPIEGWVFVNNATDEQYKWKPVKTIDAIITGSRDGCGQNIGLLGSLACSVYDYKGDLIEIARVSGMDMRDRIMMSERVPLGEVVEIAYQYVGAGGRLRHPRFKCLRPDKKAWTCRSDQDHNLAEYLKNASG